MKSKPAAFTLIELLVVITVVAILAGLLLPVLSRVQENARSIKCTSNLRQIGAALIAFAGEHNATFPLSGAVIPYQTTDPATGLPGWTEQVAPYIGTNRSIFVCPSSSKILPNNVQYSYFQGAHAAYVANNNNFAALQQTRISLPSHYILGGDINRQMFDPTDADKDDFSQDPAFSATPSPFHGGHVNLVFADGHTGAFTAFDTNVMNTHYDLKPDGTGYGY